MVRKVAPKLQSSGGHQRLRQIQDELARVEEILVDKTNWERDWKWEKCKWKPPRKLNRSTRRAEHMTRAD